MMLDFPVPGPPVITILLFFTAQISTIEFDYKNAIIPCIFAIHRRRKIMSESKNPEEFYAKLKKQLQDTAMWPSEYLYKFIVPTKGEKIEQVENIFDNMGAVIKTKQSKKGTYTSVSINVRMKNPDAVIEKYLEVADKVEGVISL
jgi:uncharacterized protein